MSIELNWQKKLPSLVGLYFVAIKLGPVAGVYDFAQWNGTEWELQTEGEVMGYVDIQEFKNSLDIKWPGEPVRVNSGQKSSGDNSELWSEY